MDGKALEDAGIVLEFGEGVGTTNTKRAFGGSSRSKTGRKRAAADDEDSGGDPFGDSTASKTAQGHGAPPSALGPWKPAKTAQTGNQTQAASGREPLHTVSAQWRDVPLEHSLSWILLPYGLTYIIQGGAVVITTPDEANNQLKIRLHSGRGIVFEATPETIEKRRANLRAAGWWGPPGSGIGGIGDARTSGGVGMGGGMGGMGGGMGGMGGGMGGLGGPLMGMGGPAPGPSTERLSSGGEGTANGAPASAGVSGAPTQEATPPQASSPSITPDGTGVGVVADSAARYRDVGSVVDLVTTTIRPTSWDEVGGPGSLPFFANTLDFVVATTGDIHDEIAALFDSLRRLPVEADTRIGIRPAEVLLTPPDKTPRADFHSFIDLITSTVEPTTWDTVGGPCSIKEEGPHVALVVSAMADIHDSVFALLTQLRRSRYESLHRSRPWGRLGLGGVNPIFGVCGGPPLSADVSLAKLPGPTREEVLAISTRTEPGNVSCTWRRRVPGQRELDQITLRQSPGRIEVEFREGPGRPAAETSVQRLRIAGDDAAVDYPTLLMTERGRWGEATRQWLDARLPWMPHRTNAEVARIFEVHRVPSTTDDLRRKAARVRLTPRGYSPQRTYIEATFSQEHGLPIAWEARFDGRLTERLRFVSDESASPRLKQVRLEDPSGKTLLEWELVATADLSGAVADPGAAWSGDLRIDGSEPALSRALAAIRHTEWATGAAELRDLAASHPRHALVLLLLAWCREHNERIALREEFLTWLGDVAAGPAIDLTRFVARGNFASLRPKELYDILARQPSSLMEFEDWERLAIAAADAGLFDKALETIETARRAGKGPSSLPGTPCRFPCTVGAHRRGRTASDRLGGRAGNDCLRDRHDCRRPGAAQATGSSQPTLRNGSGKERHLCGVNAGPRFAPRRDRDRLAPMAVVARSGPVAAERIAKSQSPRRDRPWRAIGAHRRSGGGRAGARDFRSAPSRAIALAAGRDRARRVACQRGARPVGRDGSDFGGARGLGLFRVEWPRRGRARDRTHGEQAARRMAAGRGGSPGIGASLSGRAASGRRPSRSDGQACCSAQAAPAPRASFATKKSPGAFGRDGAVLEM